MARPSVWWRRQPVSLCVCCLLLCPNTWAYSLGEEGLTSFMVLVYTFHGLEQGNSQGRNGLQRERREKGWGGEGRVGEGRTEGERNTDREYGHASWPSSFPFFPAYRMVPPTFRILLPPTLTSGNALTALFFTNPLGMPAANQDGITHHFMLPWNLMILNSVHSPQLNIRMKEASLLIPPLPELK